MAPEQYFGGYSPEKADIWAIGICLLNILFARNPFVTPTEDDLLFADFVRDRESLFDIFPTLSYDTYEVLCQCLTLDPEERSLQNVREAIERVVSWTTEDDLLDEFCVEDRDVVTASVNREPLRTPSIQSPAIAQGTCFPWAQALQATQHYHQQLPIIHDDEDDNLPEFKNEKCTTDEEYARQMGFYVAQPSSFDSGLGLSFSSLPKSTNYVRARVDNIPINSANKINTIPILPEAKNPTVSKSWSDWVDEDEEEEEREREETRKRLSWSYPPVGAAEDFGDDDVEWIGDWEEDICHVVN
jgi:serine/threonine protein kinase